MTTTQKAKKTKTPHCMEHSMLRKACPMMKENRKLVNTVMEVRAERVSSGWISDGTSQPSGPLRHTHRKGGGGERG